MYRKFKVRSERSTEHPLVSELPLGNAPVPGVSPLAIAFQPFWPAVVCRFNLVDRTVTFAPAYFVSLSNKPTMNDSVPEVKLVTSHASLVKQEIGKLPDTTEFTGSPATITIGIESIISP